MGNELYKSFDAAPQLYQRAKQIDPTRLVIDSDGCNFEHKNRETLDFLVVQFGEGNSCGFQDAKYNFPSTLAKPVVAHEMGYFVTLPELTQIDLFGKGLRPYWLFQTRALAAEKGMTERYRQWVELSNRLQATCLKSNIEAARRSNLSGYSQWLFQDYPNCAEGVVDMFFRPKGSSAAEFRKFNAPSVLLLDVPRRNYYFGETADLKLLASRYEDDPSEGAVLRWELRAGSEILASGKKEGLTVTSEGLQTLMPLPLAIPQRPQAEKLTLAVELTDSICTLVNDWNFWVFPKEQHAQATKNIMIGEPKALQKVYPAAREESPGTISPDMELLITSRLRAEQLSIWRKADESCYLRPREPFLPSRRTSGFLPGTAAVRPGQKSIVSTQRFGTCQTMAGATCNSFTSSRGRKRFFWIRSREKFVPWFAALIARSAFRIGRIFSKPRSATESSLSAASILPRRSE